MPVCRHKSNKWLFFSFESTLGSKFHAFRFLSASPRWGSQTKPLLKALWFLVAHLLSKQTRARNAASLHFPQCASRNLRSVGRVNGTSKRLATLIRYKQLLCDAWNLQKRARYQNSGAKTEKKAATKSTTSKLSAHSKIYYDVTVVSVWWVCAVKRPNMPKWRCSK